MVDVHCKRSAGGHLRFTRRWWSSGGQFGLKLAGAEGDTAGGVSSACWLVFGVPDVSSATHCAIMGETVATLAGLAAIRAASVR